MSKAKLSDHEIATIFEAEFKPLLVHLYSEAGLAIPQTHFDHLEEGPRLVVALRTQGFNAKFGEEII